MPRTRVQDTHRHLRNACEHTKSTTRTSYKNSFFPTTTREWNQLPQATQNLAHCAFKKQLCRQLGEPNPPLHFNIGSKRGNILHAKLRMNMTHLNSHLYEVQKTSSPECHCGYRNENLSHFVLYCPSYKNQREELFSSVSQNLQNFRKQSARLKIRTLTHGDPALSSGGSLEVALHVQTFLLNTQRFNYP